MKSSDLRRYTFDLPWAPGTTNGAYAPGDIIGGLITIAAARVNDEGFLLSGAAFLFKANVQPSLTLHLFNTDLPNTSAKADNDTYALNAMDLAAWVMSYPFSAMGAQYVSHGTPKSVGLDNFGLITKPKVGTKNLYGLLVTAGAVTLTSTTDLIGRFRGAGA